MSYLDAIAAGLTCLMMLGIALRSSAPAPRLVPVRVRSRKTNRS